MYTIGSSGSSYAYPSALRTHSLVFVKSPPVMLSFVLFLWRIFMSMRPLTVPPLMLISVSMLSAKLSVEPLAVYRTVSTKMPVSRIVPPEMFT